MKKTPIIILIVLAVCVAVFALTQKQAAAPVETAVQQTAPHVVDENLTAWKTYSAQNVPLTFSYPETTFFGETKIFEEGNIVFVAPELSEIWKQREKFAGKTEAEMRAEIANIAQEPGQSQHYAVVVRDAESTADVEAYFKTYFGQECVVKEYWPRERPDMLSVVGGSPDENPMLGSAPCYINYMAEFFYSPLYKKIAVFTRGQEPQFYANPSAEISFDDRIVEGIFFTPPQTTSQLVP